MLGARMHVATLWGKWHSTEPFWPLLLCARGTRWSVGRYKLC